MNDPAISVTMPKSQWQALLTTEPYAKETYTDEGVTIFNAFQAIHRAVDDPPKAEAQ